MGRGLWCGSGENEQSRYACAAKSRRRGERVGPFILSTQSMTPRNSFQRGNQVSSAHTGCHGRAIPGGGVVSAALPHTLSLQGKYFD